MYHKKGMFDSRNPNPESIEKKYSETYHKTFKKTKGKHEKLLRRYQWCFIATFVIMTLLSNVFILKQDQTIRQLEKEKSYVILSNDTLKAQKDTLETALSYQRDHLYRMVLVFDMWLQKQREMGRETLPFQIQYVKQRADSMITAYERNEMMKQ